MLSEDEEKTLELYTLNQRTPDILRLMRDLAEKGRIKDIAEAIQVVVQHCDANGAMKRNFLVAQVPGLLSSGYFPSLGQEWFETFIKWSIENPQWQAELPKAARESGAALEKAVARIQAAVEASV